MSDSPHNPTAFRITPDTHPKRVGKFQLEAKRGRNWTVVSWGLSNDDADKQAGYAAKAGYPVYDSRHAKRAA